MGHDVCNTESLGTSQIYRVVNKEAVSPAQFMTLCDIALIDLDNYKGKLEQFLNLGDVVDQVAHDGGICLQFV